MSDLSPEQLEVANFIVDVLNLEDVRACDIDPDAPLFRDGLGLDSIDALELSLAIKQKYGFEIRSKNEENVRIFGSLAALTDHIQHNRTNDKR
ncbi:MAG: acyl carrier protein [Gammaproteobacteria bacterium]|nr:acyl carrier protein [Gammaproteobacteria bacterium]